MGHQECVGDITGYIVTETQLGLVSQDRIFTTALEARDFMLKIEERNRVDNLTYDYFSNLLNIDKHTSYSKLEKVHILDWFNYSDIADGAISFYEFNESIIRTSDKSLDDLHEAAIGIGEEAGEVQGVLKKYLFHSHELDKTKLMEEIGDLFWYLFQVCRVLKISIYDIMDLNIKKLRDRYPDGFDPMKSKNRKC